MAESNDPIVEAAANDVAEAVAEARTEAVQAAWEAEEKTAHLARVDALERRLGAVEAAGVTSVQAVPVAGEPTVEAASEVRDAAKEVAQAAASVAAASTAAAQAASQPAADAVDTTVAASGGAVADTATKAGEAVETAPRKTSVLFKRPFARS